MFFSTGKLEAKSFEIENIDTMPFRINFDKNKVIDQGLKNCLRKFL